MWNIGRDVMMIVFFWVLWATLFGGSVSAILFMIEQADKDSDFEVWKSPFPSHHQRSWNGGFKDTNKYYINIGSTRAEAVAFMRQKRNQRSK